MSDSLCSLNTVGPPSQKTLMKRFVSQTFCKILVQSCVTLNQTKYVFFSLPVNPPTARLTISSKFTLCGLKPWQTSGVWLKVKPQSWGRSPARDTSYLMQLWPPRHHNLSRTTPRIGWWWGWRACTSAGWSIQCFASAWSSETVEGRHLQEKHSEGFLIQEEQGDVEHFVLVPMAMAPWTVFITIETSERGSNCRSSYET